ncbi:MAG: ATP-binding cassette domain-containing protein [Salibacteraceae bacterium]
MKLEADSIQLVYGERKVLSDIYLSIETGDCVGLIGRNGCGKSSLMKIMAGALKAQSSSVRIDGMRVSQNSRQILLGAQDPCFPKNIALRKAQWFFKVDPDRFYNVLPMFSDRSNDVLGTFSFGERKLIESVVMLLSDAPFVLLDEPLTGISPIQIDTIVELIRRENSKGVLVTDQQQDLVKRICRRPYSLKSGTISALDS